MNALLICPGERQNVTNLGEALPLGHMPLVGQNIIEYWLTHLAGAGVKNVLVLCSDRIGFTRALVGDGSRWGVNAQVIEESRELSAAQASLKYEKRLEPDARDRIVVLDHLPYIPGQPLWDSYTGLFQILRSWLPRAKTPDRVGMREIKPGIWAGLHTHIAEDAQIQGPCWIGDHVFVGSKAVIGPNAIIEEYAFIEPKASIADSYVGPHTFVGRYANLRDSIAWGDLLVNWENGSVTRVPDAFLLCALRRPKNPERHSSFGQLAEAYFRNKEDLQMLWKHLLMKREG